MVASEEPRWIMGACAIVDDRWISPVFRLADDKANRVMSLTIELFEREESEVTCGIVSKTYGNVW